MGTIDAILSIFATALEMGDEYIDDPKRRLKVRLKRKEYIRVQAMELIKKEKTGEAVDLASRVLLAVVNKL